jgi:hypothetical protein
MRAEAVRKGPGLGGWERWAALVWGVALVVVSTRVLLLPGSRSVYPAYGEAGRHWRAGADLYQDLSGYRYPPPVAVLFAAFSCLPDGAAEMLWRLLGSAAFLGGLAWWGRAGLPRPLTPGQLGLLFLLAAPVSMSTLNNGQANLLLAGLLVLAVTAAARGRWNLTTLFLVLACLLKAYPVAIALLLLLLYPRQLGWRLPLALAVGAALPFALQDPDYVSRQYQNWLRNLATDDRTAWPLEEGYRDVWLLCRLWHLPVSRLGYLALQLGAAALLAGLCLAGRLAGWAPRRLLGFLFVLGCCWMMLFGPATESATYALLAAPLAWVALDAWAERRPLWVRGSVAVSYVLLAGAFVAGWFPFARAVHALGIHPLGTLILFVTLVVRMLADLARRGTAGGAASAPPSARAA